MVGFCAGLLFEGLAQEPLISNRANLNKTLSIRLKPRNIKFERPSGSALKIGNGSTVIFQMVLLVVLSLQVRVVNQLN